MDKVNDVTSLGSSNMPQKSANIDEFYREFGIKQYCCFSGGFRYIDKPKNTQEEKVKQAPKRDLYD